MSAPRRRWPRGLLLGALAIAWGAQGGALAREKPIDELLEMDLTALMEIEVTTASKQAERLFEAQATVRVIDARQIRDRGYLTLDEALGDLPGIQRRDIIGLNSYIFLRGIPNQNNLTQMLVDGVQINELNSGGFYGGGQYNLSNVKRIEVVYGPGSALYGTNAVSGVINVITKDPWDDPGLRVGALYGSFDTFTADGGYSYWDPGRRCGMRVAAMYKTSERADLAGAKGDNNWTADLETFEEDIALDGKFVLQALTVGLNFQNRRVSAATYNKAVGTEYHDHDTFWNIRFLNAYLKYDWKITSRWSLLFKTYFRDATVADDSVQKVTDEGRFGYYRPNQLLGQELMATWRPLEDLDFIGGLVFEWERLAKGYGTSQSDSPDEAPPRPAAPDFGDDFLVSSYLQGRYRLLGMFQFAAGARYDYSTVYEHVVTPRAGVTFRYAGLLARLNYGEGFRAPKPWDYSDGVGNPGLDPERIRSVELGLSYTFDPWVRLGLTGYRNVLFDGLVKADVGEDAWRWVNRGEVAVWGLEAELDVHLWRIRSFANYTFAWARDEAGDPVPEIAEHMATAGIAFDFSERIRLDLRGSYQGERTTYQTISATGTRRLDDAFIAHAALSFIDFRGFDLQLIVKNVADTKYHHPSHRAPERYRQPQRTILVKGVYRF